MVTILSVDFRRACRWTGTKSRTGSIRGHLRLLKKKPNRQVTKRSLFGLAFFEVARIRVTTSSVFESTSIRSRVYNDVDRLEVDVSSAVTLLFPLSRNICTKHIIIIVMCRQLLIPTPVFTRI